MKKLSAVILCCVITVFAISCDKEKEVAVTSVSLSQPTAEMIIGETVQLNAIVLPSDATDKSVTWASSRQSVATVSGSGKVSAVAEGISTITASAGGKSASCTVTVSKRYVAVTSVTLNKTELALEKGQAETLTATVAPDDATDKTVTWSSSASSIVSVDNSGKVTAVAGGSAVITAKAGDKQATCTVTVTVPVESITLDLNEVTLKVAESVALHADIKPENASDKLLSWISSDNNVAVINTEGVVTAKGIGDAIVTASCGGISARCFVKVIYNNDTSGPSIKSFTIEPETIDVTENSQTVTFTAHVTDETGVNPNANLQICVYNGNQVTSTVKYQSAELVSGDAKDGYYKAVMTIDQGKPSGFWIVSFYGLEDVLGYTTSGQGVGCLEVINNANNDVEGPSIESFTIEPETIDVTENSQTVTFTAHVTDETGVNPNANLQVCVYNGNQVTSTVKYQSAELVSGDAKDGYYKAVMTIDQGKPAGFWIVSFYGLEDVLGNTTSGQGVGLLEVINNANNDVEGPSIESFTIEPETIDVTENSQTVTFTAHVTDETGVNPNANLQVCVYNGNQVTATIKYQTAELISGDSKDGYYKAIMTIDQGKPAGFWIVSFYGLEDVLGYTTSGQGVGSLEVINNN